MYPDSLGVPEFIYTARRKIPVSSRESIPDQLAHNQSF
jgi:hypothetical protein